MEQLDGTVLLALRDRRAASTRTAPPARRPGQRHRQRPGRQPPVDRRRRRAVGPVRGVLAEPRPLHHRDAGRPARAGPRLPRPASSRRRARRGHSRSSSSSTSPPACGRWSCGRPTASSPSSLYRACCDVATSWAATPTSPSYYCAELVANAYGRTFTRAEITPPEAARACAGTSGSRVGLDRDGPSAAPCRRARGRRRTGPPRTMLALLSSEDWDFVVDASTAIAKSGGKAIGDLLDGMVDRVPWSRAEPGEKPVSRRPPRPDPGPCRACPTRLPAPPRPRHPADALAGLRARRGGPEHACRVSSRLIDYPKSDVRAARLDLLAAEPTPRPGWLPVFTR